VWVKWKIVVTINYKKLVTTFFCSTLNMHLERFLLAVMNSGFFVTRAELSYILER